MSAALLVAVSGLAAEPLRVFAAAGTIPAMKEIGAEYTKQTGVPVQFNFASSGALARQILAGAPFDIFFSANEKWMDVAIEKGAVDPGTHAVLLQGDLVVVVLEGRNAPADFASPCKNQKFSGLLAVGDRSVPVGMYAEEMLKTLGWWTQLPGHLCRGESVAKVLNYVVLGEVDAGIVYRSVAVCAADRVDIVATIPPELHTPVRFPVAAAMSPRPQARWFLEMLQAPVARRIFEAQGWTVLQ